MRRGGECRPAASSSSPQASALGGGSIPPPLSRLGVGFWYTFVPPSNGCFGRDAHPPSPPKTIKNAAVPPHRSPLIISPKNFWIFDNDALAEELEAYLASAEDEERAHFEEYYGEQPELIGGIYVRLRQEVARRKEARLHDSDKLYDGIASAVRKVADRLHMTTEKYIRQRFYPFLAAWRNKRITAFRRHFAKK